LANQRIARRAVRVSVVVVGDVNVVGDAVVFEKT
jgi:putative component of toxin-antitoxin plasmid stabilization module